MFNGLWKSSGAKCSEHNEDVFPSTHIFLLSNTKSTHFFRLFFLIWHISPKNRILCIDVLLSKSFKLLQRAAMHLSRIFDDLSKSWLGKKRCDRPNWYKFLKLCHHTSRILSGWEETNANGGPKWRQISKILKKSCFVQSQNFFRRISFLNVYFQLRK